ncbi:MAG TPA: ATP-binding protein [Bacteroidia bacterium]|nr:ATP-binding protein [Bacteroidia bacterium]
MYNKLLERQLKRHFGNKSIPEELTEFLKTINASYEHYAQDRLMLERSIDISSEEMIELNNKLKEEGENLKLINNSLNEAQQIAKLSNWTWDFLSNRFTCSNEFYSIFEQSPSCLMNRYDDFLKFVHPEDQEKTLSILNESLQQKKDFAIQYRIITPSEQIKTVYSKGQVFIGKEGDVEKVYGITQDISARIIAEAKIKEGEDKFLTLFEKARDPILLLDDRQRFINCNNAAVKILGAQSKEEVINRLPKDFSPEYQPDGQLSSEKSKEMDRLAFTNGNTQFEWVHQRMDKSEFLVDVSLTLIPMEDKNILMVNWRDITARKKDEEELLRKNIELTKTNSELDRFVYSVSHDLRAPLRSMLGIIEISKEDTTDYIMLENLSMLKDSIHKLDGFISDILDYSRNSRLDVEHEPINFDDLLKDVTKNLKFMGTLNRPVDISFQVKNSQPVYTDKRRLNIILNNLISNAIRYQNSQNPNPFVGIEIDTSDTETGIIVKDNGIGIRSDLHTKIFNMFFRASEESVGSGLGLYIVKEAVERLNGKVMVESEPGQGSTFTVRIPNK